MRVYVGTYAKYNSGSIDGQWLDLENYSDKEEFYAACKELHKDEEDPEFMFQDWEDIPKGMIGESWISDDVFTLAQMSENDREIYQAYLENVDQEGSFDAAMEAYYGTYKDEEDFAYSITEDCGDLDKVPDFLKNHIDWTSVARELGYDYTYVRHGGGVMVFRNN